MEIIIIDDDKIIRDRTVKMLRENGYKVYDKGNGSDGLVEIREKKIEMVLLDINLPGINGMEICKMIRKSPDKYGSPYIIMLTSNTGASDIIAGLETGADDYIKKPFDEGELLARIKVLSRRNVAQFQKTFVYKNIIINDDERIVKENDIEVEITLKEYELLKYLIINKGIALSREKIYEKIWDMPYFESNRTVDVYIHKIKKKFKEIEDNLALVRGSGYKLI